MKKIYINILFFFVLFLVPAQIQTTALLLGSIKFPACMTQLVSLPMYYNGIIIENSVDNNTQTISYEIPLSPGQHSLYVLITPQAPESIYKPALAPDVPSNTFDYFKVPLESSYKLFKLRLETKRGGSYNWRIEETWLGFDNKIPDNTLIIIYSPQLIDHLQGGSNIELPTIIIRDDILSLFSAKNLLEEEMKKFQVAAIDINTLHARRHKVSQQQTNKVLIIDCVS